MSWVDFLFRVMSGPWRWAAGIIGGICIYDALASQLRWPSISDIVPWTAGDMTWWGWLLIAQAIIMLALLDYVRNLPKANPDPNSAPASTDPEPYPDMEFDEVVTQVADHLKRRWNVEKISLDQLAREILDRAKLNDLHVWGRLGKRALAIVSPFEWQHATIDWKKAALVLPGTMSTYEVEDLHFVRREVDQVWPTAE